MDRVRRALLLRSCIEEAGMGKGEACKSCLLMFFRRIVMEGLDELDLLEDQVPLKRRTSYINLYVLYKVCFLDSFGFVYEPIFCFHICSALTYGDDETKRDWRRGKVFDDQFELDK